MPDTEHTLQPHLINRISTDLPTTVMRATEREAGEFGVSIYDPVIHTWTISEESFTWSQVMAMCVAYVRDDQYLRVFRLSGACEVYQPAWIQPAHVAQAMAQEPA
jgi:hypothetical protein